MDALDSLQNSIKARVDQFSINIPVCLYVGVGTAAGIFPLEKAHYHQYPPFIQELWQVVPQLEVLLVLIDPRQEDPPFVTFDKSNERLTVFTLRENVYAKPYSCPNFEARDITAFLAWLNAYVIQNNLTMIYHDFTGRSLSQVAEYFDHALGTHLDHVVYGLATRADYGCYFDLTAPEAFMPFYLDVTSTLRPVVRLFNIFRYITLDQLPVIPLDLPAYPERSEEGYARQSTQVQLTIKNNVVNYMLANLRLIRRLQQEQKEQHEEQFHRFYNVPEDMKDYVENLLQQRNYVDLDGYFRGLYGAILDIVAQLRYMDVNGQELLQLLTREEDPFTWHKNISLFFG